MRLWLILALVFILGVVGTISYYDKQQKLKNSAPLSNDVITVADKSGTGLPQLGGHFTLVDHMGKTRTDADFKGKYQLIYFGYTFCPDICPAALSSMTTALKMIGKKADKITPIFITVDPGRDNVGQLAVYVKNFHPNLIALTGTEAQVEVAKKAFKVFGVKVDDASSTDYLVDHSSIIYLMDPQGKFIAHFNHETSPTVIAQALQKLL